MWQASLVPDTYSVMDMGGGDAISVAALTGPRRRPADVRHTLVARQEQVRLGPELAVDGYTVNGTSPGPEIRVEQGQLLQVRLVNESVPDGVTLHWHGVDVPNAEDGVAGVTQDAVPVGGEHVYRFLAEQPGTFWYHSHQDSHAQVPGGLFGALVVTPPTPAEELDVLAQVHTYGGRRTIGGQPGERRVPAEPGSAVRVRVINTDNGLMRTWVTGAAYRVLAVDGHDLNEPPPVEGTAVAVPAGGRVDLRLTTPADGAAVRVDVGGRAHLTIGPDGTAAPPAVEPTTEVDLLRYGTPTATGPVADTPDREFRYSLGRRPGFMDGRPGLWWTINGGIFPDMPMYTVAEGEVVRVTLDNHSGEAHPMHLHGHHALVLSRNGEPSTGSPWWVDSLDVGQGETYELAFVADNPGIWMYHCHDLPHAVEGLVAHVAYAGVGTPYVVGGPAANRSE